MKGVEMRKCKLIGGAGDGQIVRCGGVPTSIVWGRGHVVYERYDFVAFGKRFCFMIFSGCNAEKMAKDAVTEAIKAAGGTEL